MIRPARLLSVLAPCLASVALAQTPAPVPGNPPIQVPDAPSTGAQPTPQAVPPPAPPSRVGPYVVLALGRSDYDYACYFLIACDNARANSGKLGFGYRSGTFAVEGWWIDFGRGSTADPGGSVQMRSLGVSATWAMRFGEHVEGLLRAGLADVRYTVARNGQSRTDSQFQPTFGLGLAFVATPVVSVELAWDLTRGDAPNESTGFVNAVSLGLRLRF